MTISEPGGICLWNGIVGPEWDLIRPQVVEKLEKFDNKTD
jgi:hypothetical protein